MLQIPMILEIGRRQFQFCHALAYTDPMSDEEIATILGLGPGPGSADQGKLQV
jgi:hypothetical protein